MSRIENSTRSVLVNALGTATKSVCLIHIKLTCNNILGQCLSGCGATILHPISTLVNVYVDLVVFTRIAGTS